MLDAPMDPRDRRVMERIIRGLPLVPEPFALIGEELGLDQNEVCNRINHLKENGVLRQLGGVFSPSRMGYRSAVVAVAVEERLTDRTAGIINLHPNITHNALYREEYNIWFALWVPPGDDPQEDVEALLASASTIKHRVMRDLSTFIDGVKLKEPEAIEIDDHTRGLIELLQKDLELIPRPYRHLARTINISEAQLLQEMQRMVDAGLVERYGGIMRRQLPGVDEVRAMIALEVKPKVDVEQAASELSTRPSVLRAYIREPREDLPYSIYAHVIAPENMSFDDFVDKITRKGSPTKSAKHFVCLREYKSCRLKYFTADYGVWKTSFLSPPVERES